MHFLLEMEAILSPPPIPLLLPLDHFFHRSLKCLISSLRFTMCHSGHVWVSLIMHSTGEFHATFPPLTGREILFDTFIETATLCEMTKSDKLTSCLSL